MISIRNSIAELEACHRSRDLALDCYLLAIRNIAHYAVELEPETTSAHRKYLEDLAAQVSSGGADVLIDSRATVRGLLREYRDRTTQYLSNIRQELSDAAAALEQTLSALSHTDGDHDVMLRNAIAQLRAIPDDGDGQVRQAVLAAASTIEGSLEQVRKQHKVTISQFLIEIRMLHKRIDGLENAASIDPLTQLYNREEMETRVRGVQPAKQRLLLLKTTGLRVAEAQFGRSVAEELAGAFTKRLRNTLPPTAIIGRWTEEEFLAILQANQIEATAIAKRIADNLTGAYACLLSGKTVRPVLQLRVGIVDPRSDDADRVLQRIAEFLNAV